MKDSSKLGLALLAGIAAGAVAGLLLAPEEGTETRKKIGKKAKDLEGKVKDKAKEWKNKAGELIGKASEARDEAVKTADGYL